MKCQTMEFTGPGERPGGGELPLPCAALKGSHQEGPEVPVSLAFAVKYLPSGLLMQNVQPG